MANPKKSTARKTGKAPPAKVKSVKAVVAKTKPVAKPKVETRAKSLPTAGNKRLDSVLTPRAPTQRTRGATSTAPVADEAPQKAQVDEDWQKNMREALASQRQRMLAVVQSTQAQMAEKAGDLPDISDRASEGFEDELAVGLMAIEAAQLEDINEAIERIDSGKYGLCVDCKKAIPRKRLEVLPFAKRCLSCEGESERRHRVAESQSDDEELE